MSAFMNRMSFLPEAKKSHTQSLEEMKQTPGKIDMNRLFLVAIILVIFQ